MIVVSFSSAFKRAFKKRIKGNLDLVYGTINRFNVMYFIYADKKR